MRTCLKIDFIVRPYFFLYTEYDIIARNIGLDIDVFLVFRTLYCWRCRGWCGWIELCVDDALSRAAPCAFVAIKTPLAWEQRVFARHGVRVLFAVNPAMRGSSDGKVEAGERDGG